MTLLDDLRQDISARQCVVVVGTGVSSAIVNDPRTSWVGLLDSGLRRALDLGLVQTAEADEIHNKISAGSTADLLSSADQIVAALGGVTTGEFGSWLREDIGYLSRNLADTGLAEAVGALGLPIMTTNYDDILETCLGRGYSTWQQPAQIQHWIRGTSDDVLHLHGHWKHPASIVLTSAQYGQLQSDDQLNALRQATAATKSMIFIGFGSGLQDPSFGALRDWISTVLRFQETRHYRLCKASALQDLRELHREEPIWPVAFGEGHADLIPFLNDLAPHVVDTTNTPLTAFESIEDQVRETAVLSAHLRSSDDARVSELLVPPVLLPVPNEEFVAALRRRDQDAAGQPSRCDPLEEATATHLVIAGDENSGVSSALLWLCSQMYLSDTSLVPLSVDYLKLGGGPIPLRKSVIKQLRTLGYRLREQDPLPRILLVLDNVNAVNRQRLDRVAVELEDPAYARVLIGCRTGTETLVTQALTTRTINFRLRYMGRLSRKDLRSLASLVDPGRSKELASYTARAVEAHGLPSTPFTLAMILSAIIRGESLMAASSPTSLLDAYVDLLLGRGTAIDDSRHGLDSANKAHILSRLAETFVRKRVGAITEFDALAELTTILDSYGWPGEASDILSDLRDRRILSVRNRQVSFTQSSYLYLFAAKRAEASAQVMGILKAEPLYFAPILAHYAALDRGDFELVRELVPGLLDPFLELNLERSQVFLRRDRPETVLSEREIEENFRRQAESVPQELDDEDDGMPIGGDPSDPDVPFPLQPVDEAPSIPRAITALGLASNLLRDTEIVEDQEARQVIFEKILRAYGRLVDLINAEPTYADQVRDMAEEFAHQLRVPERNMTRFVDDIAMTLPLSLAFAGVSATLSTSKLSRLIDSCLEHEEFKNDPVLLLMAHHILFDVHDRNWTRILEPLDERHETVLAVRTIVERMAFFAYVRRKQDPIDEHRLQEFVVGHAIGSTSGPNERQAKRANAIESLKKSRLLASKEADPDDLDDETPIGG